MNTIYKNSDVKKRTYASPKLEQVLLDSEISLTMESLIPPVGPTEAIMDPEIFTLDQPIGLL